jgi:hypothetical protein
MSTQGSGLICNATDSTANSGSYWNSLSTEFQCVLERVNNVDSIALAALNFAQRRGFVQAILSSSVRI